MYIALGIGTLVAVALLRGRTGEVQPLTNADLNAAASGICEVLEQYPAPFQTPAEISLALARVSRPDFDWPPRPLATMEHKAVWASIQLWAVELVQGAEQLGLSPCETLQQGMMPPAPVLPPTPADPAPVLPPITGQEQPPVPPPGGPGGPGGIATPLPGTDPGATPIATTPTPGQRYQIKWGDTLAEVSRVAYGIPYDNNVARRDASIYVNDNAWNRANLAYNPTPSPANTWLGPEVIAFTPPYQAIYIPPAP
jgi:hypothetical protein